MKTHLAVESDPQADIVAADLATQIERLFEACPNLCGFVVEDLSGLHGDADPQDEESRFVVSEVSFATPSSRDEYHQVCSLIVGVVSELAAEQPEAYALLRDRTIARTVH